MLENKEVKQEHTDGNTEGHFLYRAEALLSLRYLSVSKGQHSLVS